jgi:hypothetical protein
MNIFKFKGICKKSGQRFGRCVVSDKAADISGRCCKHLAACTSQGRRLIWEWENVSHPRLSAGFLSAGNLPDLRVVVHWLFLGSACSLVSRVQRIRATHLDIYREGNYRANAHYAGLGKV